MTSQWLVGVEQGRNCSSKDEAAAGAQRVVESGLLACTERIADAAVGPRRPHSARVQRPRLADTVPETAGGGPPNTKKAIDGRMEMGYWLWWDTLSPMGDFVLRKLECSRKTTALYRAPLPIVCPGLQLAHQHWGRKAIVVYSAPATIRTACTRYHITGKKTWAVGSACVCIRQVAVLENPAKGVTASTVRVSDGDLKEARSYVHGTHCACAQLYSEGSVWLSYGQPPPPRPRSHAARRSTQMATLSPEDQRTTQG